MPFTLTLTTKSGTGLVWECETAEQELTIFKVSKLEDYQLYMKHRAVEEKDKIYLAPCFLNLGDKLQEDFYNLLTSLGISRELLGYIEKSADEKEQKLYIKWLEKVNGVVNEIC